MGHADAVIMGETGTCGNTIKVLENAGVKVAEKPSDVGQVAGESHGNVGCFL